MSLDSKHNSKLPLKSQISKIQSPTSFPNVKVRLNTRFEGGRRFRQAGGAFFTNHTQE